MGCAKGMLDYYRITAENLSDKALMDHVRRFGLGNQWEGKGTKDGKPRGGDYDTVSWRLFKLAHRQEAAKRGLGT